MASSHAADCSAAVRMMNTHSISIAFAGGDDDPLPELTRSLDRRFRWCRSQLVPECQRSLRISSDKQTTARRFQVDVRSTLCAARVLFPEAASLRDAKKTMSSYSAPDLTLETK